MYDDYRARFDINKIVFPADFAWNVQKEKAEHEARPLLRKVHCSVNLPRQILRSTICFVDNFCRARNSESVNVLRACLGVIKYC